MRGRFDIMSYSGVGYIGYSWKEEADTEVELFLNALVALNLVYNLHNDVVRWDAAAPFSFGVNDCFTLKSSHHRFLTISISI